MVYRFFGLTGFDQNQNPVSYRLRVTFYDGKGIQGPIPDRVQDLFIDNDLIDNDRDLPDSPQQFQWTVPSSTYSTDKKIDVRFVKVSGPNAAVAEIWIEQIPASQRIVDQGGETSSLGYPSAYRLLQNTPNPFNPLTKIRFDLPFEGRVTLKLYDMLGREVRTILDDDHAPGYHEIALDASDLASGVYLYRIAVGPFSDVKKLTILK